MLFLQRRRRDEMKRQVRCSLILESLRVIGGSHRQDSWPIPNSLLRIPIRMMNLECIYIPLLLKVGMRILD